MYNMPVCDICKRNYKRAQCEYCKREAKWDAEIIMCKFTPRIKDALQKNKISINKKLLLKNIQCGDGIFFTGPAGTGKTTKAAQTVLECMHTRFVERIGPVDFIFETATQILFNLRRCYSDKDRDEQAMLNRYCMVDLLVIDDLGVEKCSEWVLQMFHMIIDYRYSHKKATIITSNKSTCELAKRWEDDRITSRINGMCITIGTNGKDLRG